MILNNDLNRYIPLLWQVLHESMYPLALKAVANDLAEITIKGEDIFWRRNIDRPQLELGL